MDSRPAGRDALRGRWSHSQHLRKKQGLEGRVKTLNNHYTVNSYSDGQAGSREPGGRGK